MKNQKSKKIEKTLKTFKIFKMPVFNCPQYEHEPFWSYLSRLYDYRAQLHHTFHKWEICEVIVLGLNSEFRGHVESMCPGGLLGLLSRTEDEV